MALQPWTDWTPRQPDVPDADVNSEPKVLLNIFETRLQTIHKAAQTLEEAFGVFREHGQDHPPPGSPSMEFLRTALHYLDFFLHRPFRDIQARLANMKGNAKPQRRARALLAQASHFIQKLDTTLYPFKHIPAAFPHRVPIPNPYESLLRVIASSTAVQTALHGAHGEETALLLLQQTWRFTEKPQKTPADPPKRTADGAPTMLFACTHRSSGRRIIRIFVGANLANWGAFHEARAVARAARNHQLASYKPHSDRAYRALRNHEQACRAAVRNKAVADLRKDRRVFLGKTKGFGLAWRHPRAEFALPCYVCQAMMGFFEVDGRTEERRAEDERNGGERARRDGWICHFDWDRRGDESHACAEAGAVMQCMLQNHRDGEGHGLECCSAGCVVL